MKRCCASSSGFCGANIATSTTRSMSLETSGRGDQLALRRLKKQKLALKDQIARLEDQLTPDIIA